MIVLTFSFLTIKRVT